MSIHNLGNEARIRQLSKGEGEPSYTLYVPFWTPHNSRFTLAALIPPLQAALGANYTLDTVEGRGREILQIQGFATHEAAKITFERIQAIARLLSLDSNTAITTGGDLSDPESSYGGLPEWWTLGDSTWPREPNTGRVRVDGIASILVPTIVPEHKRILDVGGRVGQIVRQVPLEKVQAVVETSFSRPPVQLSSSDELAMQAYLNACSQESQKLRFLGIVACLEVMSQPKHHRDGRDAIRRLIARHHATIAQSLPGDHPHGPAPGKAVDLAYDIRNKLAHTGDWGQFSPDDVHRSIQFLTVATRVLLKQALQP